MPPVVEIFRDLVLLRRGPQDLPYSTQLLAVLAVACIVAQAIARTIPTPVGLGESFLSAVIETLLTAYPGHGILGEDGQAFAGQQQAADSYPRSRPAGKDQRVSA